MATRSKTQEEKIPSLEIPVNEDAKLEAERDKLQQMANESAEVAELKRRLAAM